MKQDIYITSYSSLHFASHDMQPIITREQRKDVRFARRTGLLYYYTLLDIINKMNFNELSLDAKEISLYFADFLNQFRVENKVLKVINKLIDSKTPYSNSSMIKSIIKSMTIPEYLQSIPNIPTFLASSLVKSNGRSVTELSSCAGGLIGIYNGVEDIKLGHSKFVFAGAASDKLSDFDFNLLSLSGLYKDKDYKIIDGAATVALEPYNNIIEREITPLAKVCAVIPSFSPKTYLKQEFDEFTFRKLINMISARDTSDIVYFPGAHSKNYLQTELMHLNEFKQFSLSENCFKNDVGYTFSASGIFEIIYFLEHSNQKKALINSFGIGGHNCSVLIERIE